MFTHVFFKRTDLVLEGSSWAWLGLHCSLCTEMPLRALKTSQVCQGSCVAIIASSAIVAVVLVELFGLRVPGANIAFVFTFRVQYTITKRRTVVTHWAFSCSVVSFRTEVAGLASSAFVNLFCSCDYTLSLEGTIY